MRGLRYALRLLLVPALAATGAFAGWYADGAFFSTLLLLWEPVIWVLAVWAVWAAWVKGRRGLATGLASGGLAAALAAHLPAAPPEPEGMDAAPFVRSVRSCIRGLRLPTGRVRLLQWTVDQEVPTLATTITDAAPDVAVVYGPLSDTMVEAVVAGVGGEHLVIAGEEAPIHLFVRGVFNLCGDEDRWVDRPAPGADVGLVFVGLEEGSAFPLLTVRLPEPGALPDWAVAGAHARGAVRATIDALQSSTLVVSVSAPLPLGAPRLARTLRVVGLTPFARPLDWPTWSPLRLHAFDQVWGAEGWLGAGAETVRGGGSRDAVITQIGPRWPVALPAAGDDDPVR